MSSSLPPGSGSAPRVTQLRIPSPEVRALNGCSYVVTLCYARFWSESSHHWKLMPGMLSGPDRVQDWKRSWVHSPQSSLIPPLLFPTRGGQDNLCYLLRLCPEHPAYISAHVWNLRYVWNGWVNKWCTSWSRGVTLCDTEIISSCVRPLQSQGRKEQHVIRGLRTYGDWNILDVDYSIKYLLRLWQVVLSWRHSGPGAKPLSSWGASSQKGRNAPLYVAKLLRRTPQISRSPFILGKYFILSYLTLTHRDTSDKKEQSRKDFAAVLGGKLTRPPLWREGRSISCRSVVLDLACCQTYITYI